MLLTDCTILGNLCTLTKPSCTVAIRPTLQGGLPGKATILNDGHVKDGGMPCTQHILGQDVTTDVTTLCVLEVCLSRLPQARRKTSERVFHSLVTRVFDTVPITGTCMNTISVHETRTLRGAGHQRAACINTTQERQANARAAE